MQPGFESATLVRRLKDWARRRLATVRYRRVYWVYWRAKTHLWSVVIGALFVASFATAFVLRLRLGSYFVQLDPTLSSQLCIGVGAALIGLIAVVFTLSLYVIQQISDRSVPGILREYAADNVTRAVYAALSVLAIACLSGALLPSRHHPVLTLCLPIVCAVLSLILLSVLFERVAFLSDPSNIVSHVWKTGKRELNRLRAVQDELLRLNPEIKNETDPLGRTIDMVGAATATLYAAAPFLKRRLRKSLDNLHSLMRHFSAEQQYNLLRESGDAIGHLLQEYIGLRGSSLTMANTFTTMMGMEPGWDDLVVSSVETFVVLIETAIESGDTQRAQTLIRCLAKVGQGSVKWKPSGAPPAEHPTVSFVVGYLTTVARQAIVKKNDDVILAVNEQLLPIAAALATDGYATTLRWQIDEWSRIATQAVLAKRPTAATDTTKTLLKLLSFVVDRGVAAHSGVAKHLREAVMKLCRMEATMGAKGHSLGASLSVSLDTPLRVTLSGVSAVSIQAIHSKLVTLIANSNSDENHEAWRRSVHMLEEIDDGLWMWLEKIGLASVPGTQSVLFYLNQAVYSIAEQLLWLWLRNAEAKLPEIDLYAIADAEERVRTAGRIHQREGFKDRLETILSWHVIGFYSRCRKLQPPNVNDSSLGDCFASATGIATQALGLGLPRFALKVAQMVGNSCGALLKESGPADLIENCLRIAVLPELGLIAFHEKCDDVRIGVEGILKAFVTEANEIIKDHSEGFQDSMSPVRLVTERIEEFSNGTARDVYTNVALSVWRPSYTRGEAEDYLQILKGVLA